MDKSTASSGSTGGAGEDCICIALLRHLLLLLLILLLQFLLDLLLLLPFMFMALYRLPGEIPGAELFLLTTSTPTPPTTCHTLNPAPISAPSL